MDVSVRSGRRWASVGKERGKPHHRESSSDVASSSMMYYITIHRSPPLRSIGNHTYSFSGMASFVFTPQATFEHPPNRTNCVILSSSTPSTSADSQLLHSRKMTLLKNSSPVFWHSSARRMFHLVRLVLGPRSIPTRSRQVLSCHSTAIQTMVLQNAPKLSLVCADSSSLLSLPRNLLEEFSSVVKHSATPLSKNTPF